MSNINGADSDSIAFWDGREDARDAWAALYTKYRINNLWNKVAQHCKNGGDNAQYLIAVSVMYCPDFEALCRVDTQALEAARAMTVKESDMWCYLTAALTWRSTPPSRHPTNAPKVVP